MDQFRWGGFSSFQDESWSEEQLYGGLGGGSKSFYRTEVLLGVVFVIPITDGSESTLFYSHSSRVLDVRKMRQPCRPLNHHGGPASVAPFNPMNKKHCGRK
jgi:hypothetical protein